MATRSTAADEALSRLLLDIKALMLLGGSEEAVAEAVRERITLSHDEQISSFVSMLVASSKKKENRTGADLFIALSEMILASILAVMGLAILVPSIVGFGSEGQLVAYFDGIISGISVHSLSNPIVPAGEFVIAVLLLIGAFYNLRLSAASLKPIENPSSQIKN